MDWGYCSYICPGTSITESAAPKHGRAVTLPLAAAEEYRTMTQYLSSSMAQPENEGTSCAHEHGHGGWD